MVKYEFTGLTLITICYLFRMAIPFLKYPLLVLFGAYYLYVIFQYRILIRSELKRFASNYVLNLLLLSILILSFTISNKTYLVIFKSIIDTFVLISVYFLYTLIIRSKQQFDGFLSQLIKYIIGLSFLVTLYNIIQFYYSLKGIEILSAMLGTIPTPDTPQIDYNFSLVPVFFGMLGVLYALNKPITKLQKIIYLIVLLFYTLNIFISESRRGLLILLIILSILIIFQVLYLIRPKRNLKNIRTVSGYYLLALVLFAIIPYVFFTYASCVFKNTTLYYMGYGGKKKTKQEISYFLYRNLKLLHQNITYEEFDSRIWPNCYDPRDPDSGWGTRDHKTIYKIFGENKEIIPRGAKGYLMDSTSNATTWGGNAFSYTTIDTSILSEGDVLRFSVFCYVSEDFNGTWAQISIEGAQFTQDRYNLSRKGSWQRLQIDYKSDGEYEVISRLYWSKYGAIDFSDLLGYVVYAYPQVEVKRTKGSLMSMIKQGKDIILNGCTGEKYHAYSAASFGLSPRKCKEYNHHMGVFGLSFIRPEIVIGASDPDPFRRWISNIIAEDSTYKDMKSDIQITPHRNQFVGSRLDRWHFGLQIYLKEYGWGRKIIGGGFAHLNWYGNYFYGDKTKSDWPHNPLLSILLYSGILGLLLYMYFMYKVLQLYLIYRRDYSLLFIFFIITFFFSFFSGGSPFDPPIMGFFVMIPFFIHYLHKKEKSS